MYTWVTKDSEYERALVQFLELEKRMQGRLLGYMQVIVGDTERIKNNNL